MSYSLNHNEKIAENYTEAELAEGIDALHKFDLQGMVKPKNRNFIISLVGQHQKKLTLSSKQAYWVFKLMRECLGVNDDPINEVSNIDSKRKIDFAKVYDMFEEAGKHLKKPGVLFPNVLDSTYGPKDIKVYPGYKGDSLNVIVKQNYPGKVAWIGSDSSLNWKFNANLSDEQKQVLTGLLKEFAADPMVTVAKYGKLANRCCFCSKELTDNKSVSAGYGPVCAKHYGLAWG